MGFDYRVLGTLSIDGELDEDERLVIDSANDRLPENSAIPFPSGYITRPYQDGEIEIAIKRALRLDKEVSKTSTSRHPLLESESRYFRVSRRSSLS